MLVIPLNAVPAQSLVTSLGGQRCTLRIYQRSIYVPQPMLVDLQDGSDNDLDDGIGQTLVTNSLNEFLPTPLVYMDLSVNDALIVGGAPCMNGVPIVGDEYLGFIGDFMFFDTMGASDPEYAGFGGRWFLGYFGPGE